MSRRWMFLLLFLAVVAAACAPTEPIAETPSVTASPTPSCHPNDSNCDGAYNPDVAARGQAAPQPSEPEPVPTEDRYTADYEVGIDDAKWSEAGVTVEVTRMALRSRDDFCATFAEFEEPEACYADIYPGETIIALDMSVKNDHGDDVEAYADQATLVLGSEQVEGDLLGPDEVGGTIRDGVELEGQAWWLAETSSRDIYEGGELRLIIDPPVTIDDYEPVTGVYDSINFEVDW